MTVAAETISHGRSPEENDHLARSTKKIKGDQLEHSNVSMGEQPLSTPITQSDPIETDMMETTMDLNPRNEVMDVSADKCIEGSEANTKSFKQALLHSRFNENNNEIFFDCDVEDLSSDDGEDMIEHIAAEDSELNQNDQIPKVKIPHGLLKKIQEPWKKCLIIRLLGKRQSVCHKDEKDLGITSGL
ncbi:unnamed protein product [Camellia sinensis]